MQDETVVLKIGGSLYDLPDLGVRLQAWLAELGASDVILVPGGGRTADVVRDLDRRHALGEETAHWLALRALDLNAAFLAALLPGTRLMEDLADRAQAPPLADASGWYYHGAAKKVAILAPYRFVLADEGRPGCLPHSWEAASDAIAARVAVAAGASRLLLLKSVAIPDSLDWSAASRLGLVDQQFAAVLRQAPLLKVAAVNFRAWQPRSADAPDPRRAGR